MTLTWTEMRDSEGCLLKWGKSTLKRSRSAWEAKTEKRTRRVIPMSGPLRGVGTAPGPVCALVRARGAQLVCLPILKPAQTYRPETARHFVEESMGQRTQGSGSYLPPP